MYQNSFPALAGAFFGVIVVILIVALVVGILYLLTLQNTLKAVSVENRKTSPANVWLMLIPLFNFVWVFLLVGYISDSLQLEFKKRGIPTSEARPGYSIGLAMCILNCVSIIPFVNMLAGPAAIVCWIVYWVKMSQYKNLLANSPMMNIAGGTTTTPTV